MKTIAYIHGLGSSGKSFNHIIKSLPHHNHALIEYDSTQSLMNSLKDVESQLLKLPNDTALVGHSLGGLIATILASTRLETSELVTISSPLAGSKIASILRWIPGYPSVIADITPNSLYISYIRQLELDVPTISLYSTEGHLIPTAAASDGVVSVESQKALRFGYKHEIRANHFEVLMHEKTVSLINNHILEEA